MVAVLVFGDVVTFDMAVGRTRRDHRDFALEGNKCLQDGRSGAELRPDLIGIVALANERLALAVIAETAGIRHRWEAGQHSCTFKGRDGPTDDSTHGWRRVARLQRVVLPPGAPRRRSFVACGR